MNRRTFLATAALPLLATGGGRTYTPRQIGYRIGAPLFTATYESVSVHLMCHDDPSAPFDSSYRESVVALIPLKVGATFPQVEQLLPLSADYFSDLEALGFSAWIRYPTHVTGHESWAHRSALRQAAVEGMAAHMEHSGFTETASAVRVGSIKFFARPGESL